jgi:hypothetical protein
VTAINPKLIADLARLVSRYDPEDWTALSRLVQDRGSRTKLAAMLDEFADASARQRLKNQSRAPARRTNPNIRDRLIELRKSDPQRADVVNDLRMKLRSRELLPDMPSIRAFSQAVGMKTPVSGKRDQAISEIIGYLITMPDGALQTALNRATMRVDRKLGDEYEKWVTLILGPATGP